MRASSQNAVDVVERARLTKLAHVSAMEMDRDQIYPESSTGLFSYESKKREKKRYFSAF